MGHLVWNKSTGHVVGGHQRLEALDALMKTEDYELDVLQVELSLKEEVRLNVVLNNQDNQGFFDFGQLQKLAEDFKFDAIEDFGFSEEMADINFPKIPTFDDVVSLDDDSSVRSAVPEVAVPRTASAEDIARMKELKHDAREALKQDKAEFGDIKNGAKGVVTLVFKCESDKREWLTSLGLPPERNIFDVLEVQTPLTKQIADDILEIQAEDRERGEGGVFLSDIVTEKA